ncbi:receptor like protein 21-like isoform X2 [Prosopis cineraria]|uniref:receptor like protein 21-like isoform X2 n=1 Tax=Prosopis cineraria TaxID=364024 RepID=UPI00241096B6|nr:receptor like protein 21-like isoform X2 [Prosopis cineraria]
MGRSVREQVWWVVAIVTFLGFKGGSKACSEEEREALLKLKESFNHPNGSSLPYWNNLTSSDCCSWEGISCDNTQRVISLLLNHTRGQELEHIKWSLNVSYFLPFHKLRDLDLSGNYLSGLFGEIRLDNLQTLYLDENMLTEIPFLDISLSSRNSKTSAFSFNSSLLALSLLKNSLKGSLPRQGGLCNLKNLKLLSLGHNKFEGHLPSCLNHLTSLRVLDLQYNSFEGPFPSLLFQSLKSLRIISLEENHFTGIASLSLLANHSNLKLFSISCSSNPSLKLETENPPFFPSFQLKIFSVVKCNMNEVNNHRIPSFLLHQHELRLLQLTFLNFPASFPHWLLTNNSKLDSFNVSNNLLTGPFELNSTSKLLDMQYFDASSNPINDKIPPHIGSVFPNLLSLNMSSSSLQGEFPASISDMGQLNSLDLSNNNMSGCLPQEFGKGSNDLRSLKLSNNNLIGPCLPVGSNFAHLLSVDLSSNNFKGKLPDGISKSSELRMLDLSSNQLYGEMPSWIGNLKHLSYLILSQNSMGNDFTGPIPSVFAKSPMLLTLDVAKNRFSSQIPWWLKSMLNLRVLLLKGNKLDGSIPMEVCRLKNISILDLSQNMLSGGIPHCLNNVTFIKQDVMGGAKIGKFVVPWSTRSPLFVINGTSGELLQGEYEKNFSWYEEIVVNFMSKSRYESYEGNILDFMAGLDLSDNHLTVVLFVCLFCGSQ